MKTLKQMLLLSGIYVIIILAVMALLYWIAPESFSMKMASAMNKGDWEQLTGKDAELEAKIAALETRISVLESQTCSCQQTGTSIPSDLTQRVSTLESESTNQKGLLDNIYQLLLKLFGLLAQVLVKLK